MSAGEGLDEAAKDAADIAAFFKSGKSERGESGSGEEPQWVCRCGHRGSASLLATGTENKRTLTDSMGVMRAARRTCLERCAQPGVIYHLLARAACQPAAFDGSSSTPPKNMSV